MISSTATSPRLSGLRAWLAASRAGAACITKPVSIAYLTGFSTEPFERLMALAVRSDEATLIVPAIEREKAEGQASHVRVESWKDGDDPYELLRRALAGRDEIAVEKDHLSVAAAERLADRAGVRSLVDAGPQLRRMRLIKDAAEIESLARASSITDQAGEAVIARLRSGLTELDVAEMLAGEIRGREGSLSFPSLVQSGPNSALPHLQPTSRKLARGDFVLLDFGAAVDGYHADTTRMAVIGDPSDRHRDLHRVVLEAHDAAVAAVRAGVTTGDVDRAARSVIERAGLGDAFFHRVGHGIGLEEHEDPSLDPGSAIVIEPGMTFTIEPGAYLPGFGGVRIEDDIVVEPDGCRMLTATDRSLRTVPA